MVSSVRVWPPNVFSDSYSVTSHPDRCLRCFGAPHVITEAGVRAARAAPRGRAPWSWPRQRALAAAEGGKGKGRRRARAGGGIAAGERPGGGSPTRGPRCPRPPRRRAVRRLRLACVPVCSSSTASSLNVLWLDQPRWALQTRGSRAGPQANVACKPATDLPNKALKEEFARQRAL